MKIEKVEAGTQTEAQEGSYPAKLEFIRDPLVLKDDESCPICLLYLGLITENSSFLTYSSDPDKPQLSEKGTRVFTQFENDNPPLSTICGHLFHESCLMRYARLELEKASPSPCPICRHIQCLNPATSSDEERGFRYEVLIQTIQFENLEDVKDFLTQNTFSRWELGCALVEAKNWDAIERFFKEADFSSLDREVLCSRIESASEDRQEHFLELIFTRGEEFHKSRFSLPAQKKALEIAVHLENKLGFKNTNFLKFLFKGFEKLELKITDLIHFLTVLTKPEYLEIQRSLLELVRDHLSIELWESIISKAAKSNNAALVELLLERQEQSLRGLEKALSFLCETKYLGTARKLLRNVGKKISLEFWEICISQAAFNENINLLQDLLKLEVHNSPKGLAAALSFLCEREYLSTARELLKRAEGRISEEYRDSLIMNAASAKNSILVQLLLAEYAFSPQALAIALGNLTHRDYLDTATELLRRLGKEMPLTDWDGCISHAARLKNPVLVQSLLNLEVQGSPKGLGAALSWLTAPIYLGTARELLKRAEGRIPEEYRDALIRNAADSKNSILVKLLLAEYAFSPETLAIVLEKLTHPKHLDAAKELLKRAEGKISLKDRENLIVKAAVSENSSLVELLLAEYAFSPEVLAIVLEKLTHPKYLKTAEGLLERLKDGLSKKNWDSIFFRVSESKNIALVKLLLDKGDPSADGLGAALSLFMDVEYLGRATKILAQLGEGLSPKIKKNIFNAAVQSENVYLIKRFLEKYPLDKLNLGNALIDAAEKKKKALARIFLNTDLAKSIRKPEALVEDELLYLAKETGTELLKGTQLQDV